MPEYFCALCFPPPGGHNWGCFGREVIIDHIMKIHKSISRSAAANYIGTQYTRIVPPKRRKPVASDFDWGRMTQLQAELMHTRATWNDD